MLRQPLLTLSRSDRVKGLVTTLPLTSAVVARYVPGETTDSAAEATRALIEAGLEVSLDFLGEDTTDRDQAEDAVSAYLELLTALAEEGYGAKAEVSLKLSAVGQALPGEGEKVSVENARTVCRAASNSGTTVTLDMEDHATTDATLRALRELRLDFPETGGVLQAHLHRTEADCRELAHEGSRIRLCKGAYDAPEEVAFQSRIDVDRSYVRCLAALMYGDGYPMVATHDPRMITITEAMAKDSGRAPGSFEFQMLYGIRPEEQRRLAADGHRVRVYVPYGQEWYGYLVRRLAERPANLTFFLRSLVSRS